VKVIDRPAIVANCSVVSDALDLLLASIVTGLAQGLGVLWIYEQVPDTPVGPNVIDGVCRGDTPHAPAKSAKRLGREPPLAKLQPRLPPIPRAPGQAFPSPGIAGSLISHVCPSHTLQMLAV
jgi:hypothetical protein